MADDPKGFKFKVEVCLNGVTTTLYCNAYDYGIGSRTLGLYSKKGDAHKAYMIILGSQDSVFISRINND